MSCPCWTVSIWDIQTSKQLVFNFNDSQACNKTIGSSYTYLNLNLLIFLSARTICGAVCSRRTLCADGWSCHQVGSRDRQPHYTVQGRAACSSGMGSNDSIPTTSKAQQVPSFRRWQLEMKLSPRFLRMAGQSRHVHLGRRESNKSQCDWHLPLPTAQLKRQAIWATFWFKQKRWCSQFHWVNYLHTLHTHYCCQLPWVMVFSRPKHMSPNVAEIFFFYGVTSFV